MGGFPALRCGLLLKTETAISGGGQFPWYPAASGPKHRCSTPFDPLCACNAQSKTKLICCHSTGYPADVQSVEMLQRIMPIELVPIEAPGHAFLALLWSAGKAAGVLRPAYSAANPAKRRLSSAVGLTKSLRRATRAWPHHLPGRSCSASRRFSNLILP